jgi:hypothetical protein
MKELITLFGKMGEFGVIGAACYWGTKVTSRYMMKGNAFITSFWRKAFLFFKENHTFLGWFILAVASSHTLYFLLKPDEIERKNPSRSARQKQSWEF